MSRALNPKDSGTYAWVISLSPTGLPIGGCGLDPGSVDQEGTAEIGYWLGEEYWGKGYGSEMCTALTAYAFGLERGIEGDRIPLVRVGATVTGGNVASGNVLVKCGYRHEGTLRRIVWRLGERKDLEMYGLLREEWEEVRANSNR